MSARFVLLRHDCPPASCKASHWDFMVEHEGALLTWQLNELPTTWAEQLHGGPGLPGDAVEAIRLADHRMHYLEYEGPISGDRGSVERVVEGTLTWIERNPVRLVVQLHGDRLIGRVTLEQQDETWIFAVENSRG